MIDKPDRKVGVGAMAGALSILIVWGMTDGLGWEVPATIASAITVVVTFITSYFVPAA